MKKWKKRLEKQAIDKIKLAENIKAKIIRANGGIREVELVGDKFIDEGEKRIENILDEIFKDRRKIKND